MNLSRDKKERLRLPSKYSGIITEHFMNKLLDISMMVVWLPDKLRCFYNLSHMLSNISYFSIAMVYRYLSLIQEVLSKLLCEHKIFKHQDNSIANWQLTNGDKNIL